MPPDITAGLITQAGPLPPSLGPPGAASPSSSATSPASGAVSAALFASLLTQSSPPSLQLPPKTDAPPIIKLGLAAQQTLKPLKTMDTLPALSFPTAGTATKASELLLPSPTGRKTAANNKAAAEDTAADAAANALNAAPTAVPVVVPVQAVLLQAVLLPVLTPVATSVPMPAPIPARTLEAAGKAAGTPVPIITSATLPATTAAPGLNAAALPQLGTPAASILDPSLAASLQPAPSSLPSPSLQVQLSQPPQATAPQAAGQAALPAAPLLGLPKSTTNSPASGRAVPQFFQPAPVQASSPAQAAPLSLLPSAQGQAALIAQVLSLPSAAPAPALGPAKQPGKFIQTALKSLPANADTYTRITPPKTISAGIDAKLVPVETAAVSAKAALPTNMPEAGSGSLSSALEKTSDPKAEAKAPAGMPDAGLLEAGILPAQAAPSVTGPTGKPLSFADQIKIVHQVADGVGAMPLPAKPDGVEQMSLQLHPKDWGSLQVSVSVTPGQEAGSAKTVTAHIVAETPQVKAALQSQTGALHQALRASGLNLEHLTVSVKPAAQTAPAAQSASAGFSGGQGQPASSHQAPPSHAAAGSQPAGMQFGTSAGSSQNGRQGQPTAYTSTAAQAEAEEIAPMPLPINPLPMRPSGRFDTRA